MITFDHNSPPKAFGAQFSIPNSQSLNVSTTYRIAYSKIKKILQDQSFAFVYGPQFVGKTSFIRAYFKDYNYISLKKKHLQDLLKEDPYRFFAAFEGKTIFDDLEQCSTFIPLFERYSTLYYQQGQVIMLSSVKLPEAKENASVQILPLSVAEWKLEKRFVSRLEHNVLQGGFLKGDQSKYKSMVQKIMNDQAYSGLEVRDRQLFYSFFNACLTQIDQPLNRKELASKIGISAPTANAWIEKLESLGLIYLLPAYPFDFGKRAAKGPKMYAVDTGMACHFLKINDSVQLTMSPFFQALVHNFYIMEIRKKNEWELHPKKCFYWKESNGHECPLLIENPTSVDIFELSSSTEYQSHLRREMDYFDEISNGKVLSKSLIYGGFRNQIYRDVELVSWQNINPA